jgi:hypothetical protein
VEGSFGGPVLKGMNVIDAGGALIAVEAELLDLENVLSTPEVSVSLVWKGIPMVAPGISDAELVGGGGCEGTMLLLRN